VSTAILSLIIKVFGVSGGTARLIAIGMVAIAVFSLTWSGLSWLKRLGAAEATSTIERKDHEAGIAANEARDRLRSCFGRGGMPDPRTGQCDR